MQLTVGQEYISKCGNCIKIEDRVEREDAPGEFTYKGTVKTVKPENKHEVLVNKTHLFYGDGKWTSYPGGIHDLVKEREKA